MYRKIFLLLTACLLTVTFCFAKDEVPTASDQQAPAVTATAKARPEAAVAAAKKQKKTKRSHSLRHKKEALKPTTK